MQGIIYKITAEQGKSVIDEIWESIYSLEDRTSYLEEEITKYVTLEGFESEISRIDSSIATKQDTLVSGENIKTLNGESLLGAGNVEIEGGVRVFDLRNLHASDSVGTLYSYMGDVYGAIVHLGEFSFQNFSIERFVDWQGATKYRVSLSTFDTPNKSFSDVSFDSSTWLQYLYSEAKGVELNHESANKFVTALPNRAGFGAQTISVSDVQGLSSQLGAKADLIDGKVPVGQLPSSLDDVREYDSLSDMPQEGEVDVLYIAKDTNKQYRYDATDGYVELSTADCIEVVNHQRTIPLTDAQIAKALAGKLAVLAQISSDFKVLMVPYDINSNVLRFVSSKVFGSSMADAYFPYIESATYYSVELNVSTKLFSFVTQSGRSFLASNRYNAFGDTEIPDVSGKQIVRALNLRKTQDMIANVYDATATYNVGDMVIYQNQLYRCTTAITVAEAWDATHWQLTNVVDYVKDTEQVGVKYLEITNSDINVQLSEARGAEIQGADVLLYNHTAFWKYADMPAYITFKRVNAMNTVSYEVSEHLLDYTISTRTLTLVSHEGFVTSQAKVASEFSTSGSYAIGDLVWRSSSLYRCIVAHTGAWDATHFQQTTINDAIKTKQDTLVSGSNIKTINGESLLGSGNITLASSDIVEVSNVGIQTDDIAAKIVNAKALVYDGHLFTLNGVSSTTMEFINVLGESDNRHNENYAVYIKASKNLAINGRSYTRVQSIGELSGAFTPDASFKVTPSSDQGATTQYMGITGKLPYLTAAPTADNTSGFISIVVLDAEPATRYEGYLYIITASAA